VSAMSTIPTASTAASPSLSFLTSRLESTRLLCRYINVLDGWHMMHSRHLRHLHVAALGGERGRA
jgi:hypothetical protein